MILLDQIIGSSASSLDPGDSNLSYSKLTGANTIFRGEYTASITPKRDRKHGALLTAVLITFGVYNSWLNLN